MYYSVTAVKAANAKLKETYLVNPLSAENTDILGEVPEGFVQDLNEVETDPVETEPDTSVDTTPDTDLADTTVKSGCKSAISLILPAILAITAIPVVMKKKEDQIA